LKLTFPNVLRYLASFFAVSLLLVACGGGGSDGLGVGVNYLAAFGGTKQMGVAAKSTTGTSTSTDANGNVYVAEVTYGGLDGNTLTGNADFFLTKYDATGIKLYTKQMGVTGVNTVAYSVATDGSGNVYVAGYTEGGLDGNFLTGTSDFFLTKYDAAGNKLYTKQMGAVGVVTDTGASHVATDASGNVYVAGYTAGGLDGNTLNQPGYRDIFLTKYDAAGNKLYTKQMDGMGATGEVGGIDANGNVYYTGYTGVGLDGNIQTGTMDLFLIKYSASGIKLYTKQMGVAGHFVRGYSTATDASSNTYVTGYTDGGLDGNALTGTNDSFLTKYDASGNKLYTRQLGVAGKSTSPSSVVVDANGNVYVTGYTNGGLDGNTLTGADDLFLTKYDSTGIKLYTRQLGVTGKSTYPWYNAIDANGNVFVTGNTNGGLDGNTLTGTSDFFLVKYNSAGTKQ
jgi:hypothetical protein